MTGIAHGIDLIEIKRLRELNPAIRERFLRRVFTVAELAECDGRAASLAGKFAAKEAAAKALGCGIGRVSWQEIEVLSDEQGKPELFLHGSAAEISNLNGWTSSSLSISHTAELATASLIALFELPK